MQLRRPDGGRDAPGRLAPTRGALPSLVSELERDSAVADLLEDLYAVTSRPKQLTMARLVAKALARWNLVPFPKERKAIDVGDFICDYSSFSSAFGWDPKIKFEEGIKRSLEYFRSELEHYI